MSLTPFCATDYEKEIDSLKGLVASVNRLSQSGNKPLSNFIAESAAQERLEDFEASLKEKDAIIAEQQKQLAELKEKRELML